LSSFSSNKSNQERIFINYQIKSQKVLCIDQNNANLGVLPLSQAIDLASLGGLDLVQIAQPNKDGFPTCKILDSGKYKFSLSKKRKESDKKQRESAIRMKEIKFRPSTDLNDLKTKAKKAEEFISEGCKVKVTISFKGREINNQAVAYETLNTFIGLMPDLQMLGRPSIDRKDLTVFIGKKEQTSNVQTARVAS
jgi:translation initiation factor IF-3